MSILTNFTTTIIPTQYHVPFGEYTLYHQVIDQPIQASGMVHFLFVILVEGVDNKWSRKKKSSLQNKVERKHEGESELYEKMKGLSEYLTRRVNSTVLLFLADV